MEDSELMNNFNALDNRIDNIEKQLPVINERYKNMNDLFQRNIAVLDKLEESFQDNRLVMQAMTSSVEQSNKEIASMKDDIHSLKDERNFNISRWIKNNFISIVTLVTLACYLISKL